MAGPVASGALRDQLAGWIAAGLIDEGQARRIDAAEQEQLEAVAPGRLTETAAGHRLPLIAEVLGYLGAAIAVAGGVITVGQSWQSIPAPVQLALFAVAAIGLLGVGAAMPAGKEPAFARLRSVVWLLATASVTAFAAVLTQRYLDVPGSDSAMIWAAAWLACAAPLWWRTRSALQHLAAFGGTITLAEIIFDRLDSAAGIFGYGLALWIICLLWAAATQAGYLPPRGTGFVLSGAGLLTGAIICTEAGDGLPLAILTVAGLLTAGIMTRRVLVIVIGAIGAMYVVPYTAAKYLPGSVGTPPAAALTGLALLGMALWLARKHHQA
ncbi:MAG TPA: DUF2157 domain-containing protein [Streptosporangiaceae bacterium]|jgi:hypothetical protein